MEIGVQTRKRSSDHSSEDDLSDLKHDCDGEVHNMYKKKQKTDPKTTKTAATDGAILYGDIAVQILASRDCNDDNKLEDTNKDMAIIRANHQNMVEKEGEEGRKSLYQRRLAQNRKTAQKRRDRNRKHLRDLSRKKAQLDILNANLKNENNLIEYQISVMARMLAERQQQRYQQARFLQYQHQCQQNALQMKQHQVTIQQQNPYVQKYNGQESLGQQTSVNSLKHTTEHPPQMEQW